MKGNEGFAKMVPSFHKDTIITFCARVIAFGLSMVCGIIFARILGPSDRGVVSICILIPSTATLFLSFDIGIGVIYFSGNKRYKIQSLIDNSLFLAIIIGLVIYVLLILLASYLNFRFLGNGHKLELYLVAVFPILMILANFLSGILLGLRRIIQLSLILVISSILLVCSALLFLYIFKLNILGAILSYGLMYLASLIMSVFLIAKDGYVISFKPQLHVILDLVKYSIKNYFGSIFQNLNYRLDMFLIAYFLKSSDVGLYVVAVGLAEMIWRFPESVGYVLFPRTSASSIEEANKFTPIVMRNTLLITFVFALIAFFSAPWAIPLLFGASFADSVLPLRMLLPGIVALGLWKLTCYDMAGRGLPQYKSYSAGVSLPVTIILDILLIPKFGIVGAALASSITYIIATAIAISGFIKVSNAKIFNILVPVSDDFRYVKMLLKTMKG